MHRLTALPIITLLHKMQSCTCITSLLINVFSWVTICLHFSHSSPLADPV